MSNFVVAVGGSGAKLMQTLIHLGAAGLMPSQRRELTAVLVDPDENNGNVTETRDLAKSYEQCRTLKLGTTELFSSPINVTGPWTPMRDGKVDTLNEIFQYDRLALGDEVDADLLELLFEPAERAMSIRQGFRGRPAIGATVLAEAVHFTESPWKELKEKIDRHAEQGVHVLLAGSVFGGSGASGVPTLVRLIRSQFTDKLAKLRMGLVLFLPFFQFRPVPGEEIQADPAAFPMATAEALKYYHERGFLADDFCHAIYCVGEQVPAQVLVSAVGAAEQRNEAHFVELIAGMGAMRFFNDQLSSRSGSLAVAGRNHDGTVTWDDLPYDKGEGARLIQKLQQMTLFAVAYRYIFSPQIEEGLRSHGSKAPFWVDHVERPGVNLNDAGRAWRDLNTHLEHYLTWMLSVCTPQRDNFASGLINVNVFAEQAAGKWRLKDRFSDRDFANVSGLLLNRPANARVDDRQIRARASRSIEDNNAVGPGQLVRAIYDACALP